MFAPTRLVMLALAGVLFYAGFVAIPGGDRSVAAFAPEPMADYQVAVWQAAATHQETTLYLNMVRLLREQHRYTWFRAAQAGYSLAMATADFGPMTTRFERVLPHLQEAARIEKTWRDASFSETEAARAQLNWWVTLKSKQLRERGNVGRAIAADYELRYGVSSGYVEQSAADLAAAIELRDDTRPDTDWEGVRQLLVRSYRALRMGLDQAERARRAAS